MTQVCFVGHVLESLAEVCCSFEMDCGESLLPGFCWRSLLAAGESEVVPFPKSNAPPAVFGVFEAAPKAANAPEPNPNAELGPGDDTEFAVLRGGRPLLLLE